MLRFNKKYFILTSILFIIEVLIALFVHDNFVRPYLGDVLVVILIYCFVKTFLNFSSLPTALFVLLFAFTVEWLQYVNIIEILGVQNKAIARTIIGTSFSWMDMLAYVAGIFIILIVERIYASPNNKIIENFLPWRGLKNN